MNPRNLLAPLLIGLSAISMADSVNARDRVSGCPNCTKRTYGYNEVWSAQQASVSYAGTCLAGTCTTPMVGRYSATALPPAGIVDIHSPIQPELDGVDVAIEPTFRLCVVCPADATVIIDGHPTRKLGEAREYQLNLPTNFDDHPVRIVILQAGPTVLSDTTIVTRAGGSDTVFATKTEIPINEADDNHVPPAPPADTEVKSSRLPHSRQTISARNQKPVGRNTGGAISTGTRPISTRAVSAMVNDGI